MIVREGGEANFFDLLDREDHWFAQIQFNGELTDEKQLALATKMAEGAIPAPVRPAPSEEDAGDEEAGMANLAKSYARVRSIGRSWVSVGDPEWDAHVLADEIDRLRAQLAERTKALGTAAYRLDEWGEYFDNIAGASDPISAQGLRRKAGICRGQAAQARAALDEKGKA